MVIGKHLSNFAGLAGPIWLWLRHCVSVVIVNMIIDTVNMFQYYIKCDAYSSPW